MTTVKALLREARLVLQAQGIESSSLDVRLLLGHVTQLAHDEIIASSDLDISPIDEAKFESLVQQRSRRKPVSRILGTREFYGRDFLVTPDVLDPRADTETLIDLALTHMPHGQPCRILDLGTGSGAIALTLLCERPAANAVAADVSDGALAVARKNAKRLDVTSRCTFYCGSWFVPVEGVFDIIVSNPPYIESATINDLSPDVKDHDPHLALDGGVDGLVAYREIAQHAVPYLAQAGRVIVEIGAGQEIAIRKIFEHSGFNIESSRKDVGGHVRCLSFIR